MLAAQACARAHRMPRGDAHGHTRGCARAHDAHTQAYANSARARVIRLPRVRRLGLCASLASLAAAPRGGLLGLQQCVVPIVLPYAPLRVPLRSRSRDGPSRTSRRSKSFKPPLSSRALATASTVGMRTQRGTSRTTRHVAYNIQHAAVAQRLRTAARVCTPRPCASQLSGTHERGWPLYRGSRVAVRLPFSRARSFI